jgi:hypothetical protein
VFLGLLHEDRWTDGRKWGYFRAHIYIFMMRTRKRGTKRRTDKNLLSLDENCKLPVAFTVYVHHTVRSHKNTRSDPVCLETRLILSCLCLKVSIPILGTPLTRLCYASSSPFAWKKIEEAHIYFGLDCMLLYKLLILPHIIYSKCLL